MSDHNPSEPNPNTPTDPSEQSPPQTATSPAASPEASSTASSLASSAQASEASSETPSTSSSEPTQDDDRNAPLGGLLVAVGALLLFINLSGIGLGGLITRLWPLLIVYAGYRQTQRNPGSQQGQIVMIVGAALLLFTIGLLSWSVVGGLLPLLLIGAGAYLVLREQGRTETGGQLAPDVKLQKVDGAPSARDSETATETAPRQTVTSRVREDRVREERRDKLDITLLFGQEVRRVVSEAFRGGEATVILGGLELDLSAARLSRGEAELELNVIFGNLKLIVPDDWTLDVDESVVAGRLSLPDNLRGGGGRLELEATCLFSRVEIVRRHALPGSRA